MLALSAVLSQDLALGSLQAEAALSQIRARLIPHFLQVLTATPHRPTSLTCHSLVTVQLPVRFTYLSICLVASPWVKCKLQEVGVLDD